MDAILKSQAEQLAREMATQVTTLDDLNGLMRGHDEDRPRTDAQHRDGRPPRTPGRLRDRRRRQPPAPAGNERATTRPRPRTAATDIPRRPSAAIWASSTSPTPRDRDGTFEPQLVAKHQRRLDGFDEKILALYAKGMTTRDIQDVVKELYGVEVSPTLVSEITADLDAEVDGLADAPARCGLADRATSTASWSTCAARTAGSPSTRCTSRSA